MPDRFPDRGPLRVLRDRDTGEVLRAAFAFVRAEARPLFTAVFAIAAPMYLLSGVVTALTPPPGPSGVSGLQFVSSVLGFLGGVLVSAAVFGYALRVMRGAAERSVAAVWEEAKGLVVPLLFFTLGTVLLAALAAVPLLLALGLAAAAGPLVGGAVGVLLAVGVLVALVAVVGPAYLAAQVAVAVEGERTLDAWREGLRLVAAGRGTAAGTFLLLIGLSMVLGVALVAVFGALALVGGTDPLDPSFGAGVAGGVATALSSLALLPVSVVFTAASLFLFGALAARTDGVGLDDGLAALEAAPEDPLVADLRERVERPERPDGDAPRGFRGGGL